MTSSRTKRSAHAVARFAAALMATSVLAVLGGPANAEPPAWAKQCAATTPNPWIRSGYCETHQAWDKYYCQCAFVPNHPLPGLGGHRRGLTDDVLDDFSDSDEER